MRTCPTIGFLRSGLVSFIALALVFGGFAPVSFAQVDSRAKLTIIVIEGEGEYVNIQNCCETRRIVVEVRNEYGAPVPDAQVTFILPTRGPSGYFPGNASRVFVTTDGRGQAAASGLRHNGVLGQFLIRVLATYQTQRGSSVITQNNASFTLRELAPEKAAREQNFQVSKDFTNKNDGFKWKKWGIVGGIAVGGLIAYLKLTGGDTQASTVTINIGQPTIGGGQ